MKQKKQFKLFKNKIHQLLVIVDYQGKQEIHTLHVGPKHQCVAVKLLAKQTEKKYIPKEAKVEYKIERIEEIS